MKHHQKQVMQGLAFLVLHVHILASLKEVRAGLKQGHTLEAAADIEAIRALLTALFTWLAQPASYRTQEHQPRDALYSQCLGPPH